MNVANQWNYMCLIRKIVAYVVGKYKNGKLVKKELSTIQYDLSKVKIFHIDRENEFKNIIIDKVLDIFNINRLLSAKECLYDNVAAEVTYKIIKTEFSFHRCFKIFNELEKGLFNYVNWYNNMSIHKSLYYKIPVEYQLFS